MEVMPQAGVHLPGFCKGYPFFGLQRPCPPHRRRLPARQLYSPECRHQSITPALRPSDIKRRLTLGVERNGYVAMVSPGAGFVSGSHRARGCIGVSMTHWFDSLFYANLYSHFLTTNTGHGACRTTRSAVLPMNTCLRPVRAIPCVEFFSSLVTGPASRHGCRSGEAKHCRRNRGAAVAGQGRHLSSQMGPANHCDACGQAYSPGLGCAWWRKRPAVQGNARRNTE